MKRFLIAFLLMFFVAMPVFGADAVYNRDSIFDVVGWSVHGSDDDIDATAELITELDTTFAQLAAEDTLEILSSDALDITQTVTVYGINSSGNQDSEAIALNTSDGTTVVAGTTTFRYVDQVEVDKECVGVITIRRTTGDTFITSIPIGVLEATMVQHFNGGKVSYVTSFSGRCTSTTGTVLFELRWYPDDADALDAGDGYKVIDSIQFTNVLGSAPNHIVQPIKLPKGGWIAVYGTGGAANCDGSVTIQGFDTTH